MIRMVIARLNKHLWTPCVAYNQSRITILNYDATVTKSQLSSRNFLNLLKCSKTCSKTLFSLPLPPLKKGGVSTIITRDIMSEKFKIHFEILFFDVARLDGVSKVAERYIVDSTTTSKGNATNLNTLKDRMDNLENMIRSMVSKVLLFF